MVNTYIQDCMQVLEFLQKDQNAMNNIKDHPQPTVRNRKRWRDSPLLPFIIGGCFGIFTAEMTPPGPWWTITNFLKTSVCVISFIGAIWFISQAVRGFHFGWPSDDGVKRGLET